MTYDFSNPQFKNGVVTFGERKPDLLHIFRQTALRKKYVLKTDMILYSPEKVRIAKVQNYFDMLIVTMLSTRKYKKLYTKQDIEKFFREINENTEFNRGVGMNLNEAKQYLKKQGYIIERKGDFYDPSTRPEFYDPDYYAEDGYDASDEESDCANYAAEVEKYLKTNYPDRKVEVNYDISDDGEYVKYKCGAAFIFDHLPTDDEVYDCENISSDIATDVDDCGCPWDDGETLIFAVVNGKKKDISDTYNKNPEGIENAEYFEVVEMSYGQKRIPEPEDTREYDW